MWTCREHGRQRVADLQELECVRIRLDGSHEPFTVHHLTCVRCERPLVWIA